MPVKAVERAIEPAQDLLGERARAERAEQGGQIRDRLVDRERLRGDGVVEMRGDPVQDRVRRFVGDDVLRMARVDAAPVRRGEVEELQAVRLPLVERVRPLAGARHHE
jgi:hypothetical protein